MSFTDLPLISDLLKSHKCKSPRSASLCTCKLIGTQKSKPLTADKRLQNWEEWMRRRKEVHQRLGHLLQRDPGSLLMNSAEEYRTVKERKLAMEYTKIPQPDPQRGCPGFWKMPVKLKDTCGKETSCFGVVFKEDKCEIPVIEHVGLPKHTKGEKDVLPRTRNSCILWEQSTYLQEKFKEVGHKKMNLVDPYKPDFEDLFIKGSSLHRFNSNNIQKLITPEVTAVMEKNILKCDCEHSRICLSINDLQIGPHLDISGTRKVYVVFDYDLTTAQISTEYLTIKNEGTVAIRFSWKATERPQFFKDIIVEKRSPVCFYFNTNEDLIIPGQTLMFPIWFKSEEVGTCCEFWEFCTKPSALPVNASVVIVLHASTVIGDLAEKMDAIRERINNNIRERLIKESLSAVMSNISYKMFKPTVYSYNKKEVFETVNSKFDPLNRQPKYSYNKDVVRELQEFYKKVRRQSDPKCWNYSIEELQHLTIAKQKKKEQLKKLAEQKEAEKLHAKSPKFPALSCDKVVFSSTSVQQVSSTSINSHRTASGHKQNISTNEDSQQNKPSQTVDAKSLTEQLEIILAKLECPMVEQNFEQTKYGNAYLILCTCFNKVSEEFEILKDRLGIIKKTKYPKFPNSYVPTLSHRSARLVHEKLYDVFEKQPLTENIVSYADKPAAEILFNIPLEDCKRRYQTYYNIPDTSSPRTEKGGKKDAVVKQPHKKNAKHDKKGKKGEKIGGKTVEKPSQDSDEDDGYVVNEQFDPYAKSDLATVMFQEPEEEEDLGMDNDIQSNIDEVLPAIRRQYKYNIYVIMYNNLDKAISNIVDMIEMQPKQHVPYAVIKEIEEPNYNHRLIDLKALLVQERMDKLKAKLILYNYRKNSKLDWKNIEIQRQLRKSASESSLWSILKPYEVKPKLPETKPISYPVDHYGENVSINNEPPVFMTASTSCLDGRLDDNWEDFKDKGIQKDYGEQDKKDDLEAYVEKVISETSLLALHDVKLNKSTQRFLQERLSDEEHFYTDSDESSINSQWSDSLCTSEGLGVCNETE